MTIFLIFQITTLSQGMGKINLKADFCIPPSIITDIQTKISPHKMPARWQEKSALKFSLSDKKNPIELHPEKQTEYIR